MLSLPHLIVLFVLALIVFGPEKLPELARMLGKATSEFRRMSSDFRYQLENEVRDIEKQTTVHDPEIEAAFKAAQPARAHFESAISRAFLPPDQRPAEPAAGAAPAPPAEAPQPAPAESVSASAPQEKPADDHTAG